MSELKHKNIPTMPIGTMVGQLSEPYVKVINRCLLVKTMEFVDNYCSYGFDAFEGNNSSGYLLEKRDRMVAAEMDKYYRRAKQIIVENRALLDMIPQELVEKKTITHRDIKAIREKLRKSIERIGKIIYN